MPERKVTDAVREYFDRQKWKYRYDEETGTFGMLIKTRYEEMDACMLRAVVRHESRFTTLVTYPFRVPEEKRVLAARYISRVNYQLLLGCFELDFSDGELQYKTTCLLGDVRPEPEQVRRYIEVCIQMAEEYAPSLMDLIFRDVPPEEVFKELERIRRSHEGR